MNKFMILAALAFALAAGTMTMMAVHPLDALACETSHVTSGSNC